MPDTSELARNTLGASRAALAREIFRMGTALTVVAAKLLPHDHPARTYLEKASVPGRRRVHRTFLAHHRETVIGELLMVVAVVAIVWAILTGIYGCDGLAPTDVIPVDR